MCESFSLLHQRACAGLQLITLCKTMDIIAISTKEYLLLYRTMSWEKIYSIIYQEEFPSKAVTSLCFHPSGKYLSIGCSDSSIIMLDIESKQLCSVRTAIKVGVNANDSPIVSCSWQHFQGLAHDINIVDYLTNSILTNNPMSDAILSSYPQIWKYDGLMQVQRIGMMEYSDPNVMIGSSSIHAKCVKIMQITSQYLHFALAENGYLQCHVLGIYPLFSINLHESFHHHHHWNNSVINSKNIVFNDQMVYKSIQSSFYKHNISYTCNDTTSKQCNYQLVSFKYLNNGQISQKSFYNALGWYEQAAYLQVMIELNLTKLHDLIFSCGRKWKDACKVVLPKLNLLQDLLNTYQLNMNPIEFCYTISLCGLWHPAAATAFSQHWNDQGVQRLKSSIDAASRSIIKSLQTKAIPMVQNTLLASRELLAIHEHITKQTNTNSSSSSGNNTTNTNNSSNGHLIEKDDCLLLKPFMNLVTYLEQLLMKLDDVLYESRLAREAMLLYIQFIKDCILEANNNNSSATPQSKPDPSIRSKYHKLFDPHHIRAANKGPQAQAEYVCATHLYAYLQDCSTTVISNNRNNNDNIGNSTLKTLIPKDSLQDRDLLLAQEIFELSEKISIDHSNTLAGSEIDRTVGSCNIMKKCDTIDKQHQSEDSTDLLNSKSVLYTIKLCKELSQSIQYLAHDGMTNSISSSPISNPENVYNSNSTNISFDFNTTTTTATNYQLQSNSSLSILESTSILVKHINLQIQSDHNSNSIVNDDSSLISSMVSLCDSIITAIIDLTSNELVIICYGDNHNDNNHNESNNDDNKTSMHTSSYSNESIILYCTKFSLVDIFHTTAIPIDDQDNVIDDTHHIEFKADDFKITFYTRTTNNNSNKSNHNVETSLLLTLSESKSPSVYLFRLLLTCEEIKYTSIEYNIHTNLVKNNIIVSNAILEQITIQHISTNICYCRQLPFKDIYVLTAEGERGVAVISNIDGKLLVLDIEADEEDDDDDDESDEDNSNDIDDD